MLRQEKNRITDPEEFLEHTGVYVSYITGESSFANGKFAEKYMRLLFIHSGSAAVDIDGSIYPMGYDSVVCLKEGQKVKLTNMSEEPLKACIVAFTSKLPILTDDFVKVVYADSKPLHIPSLYLEQMKRCVYGFISEINTQAPFFELLIQNGGQVLLVDIYRIRTEYLVEDDDTSSVERMKSFLELISRTYYDKYDLAKAAKITFLCPRQFTNICKQVTGMSFINYLNKVRVEKAKDLIKDTQLPITQIALIVGFENLSSFYRAFNKVLGVSPLKLRNKT
ncbi:MAG: helix-turn-helix domain-containing protein [Sedimentisphaeraceae bacterium JB056]